MELTPRRNEILRQVERFFYSEASSDPVNPAYSQSLLFLRVLSRMSDIDVDALAASLYDGDKWHAMFTLFTNAVLDSVDSADGCTSCVCECRADACKDARELIARIDGNVTDADN